MLQRQGEQSGKLIKTQTKRNCGKTRRITEKGSKAVITQGPAKEHAETLQVHILMKSVNDTKTQWLSQSKT